MYQGWSRDEVGKGNEVQPTRPAVSAEAPDEGTPHAYGTRQRRRADASKESAPSYAYENKRGGSADASKESAHYAHEHKV